MKKKMRCPLVFAAGMVFLFLNQALAAHGQELKLGLSLTVPEGNWFLYRTSEGYQGRFGFLGIAVEVRFFYLRDAYLALHAGTLVDFFLPCVVAYDPPEALNDDYSGRNEWHWGIFLSFKNGYRTDGGLCVDYGVSVTRVYHRIIIWEKGVANKEKSSECIWYTLGPAAGVAYVWPFNMLTALRYLPGIIRIDGRGAVPEYAHLLFFDIGYLIGSSGDPRQKLMMAS